MSRRLVVVLFLDLVGWTRLAETVDPEPLQLLLEQYYEICSEAVEENGGSVEKFIGDAVMAVFGAATAREDDAPRALRAAFGIRAGIAALRVPGTATQPEIHCGIAADEAFVARSSRAGLRVVGDVVNLAARLQSTATAGEVLVNETVAHLASHDFTMVPIAPLTLKGKAQPVPALKAVGPAPAAGRPDAGLRLVDRTAERARLLAVYREVTRDKSARLLAVLGPPGIGKTRLVREATDEMSTAGPQPAVLFGRCPSYGSNGSQAALVQVLDDLTRQAAASRELLETDGYLAAVLARLSEAREPGDHGRLTAPGIEEVSWVARELLGAAAITCPLVVIWDGLEWASDSLLLLIGELTDSLRELPVLMIVTARPELTERAVPWVHGLTSSDVIDVSGLGPKDSAELAALLAGSGEAEPAEVEAHALPLDRVTMYSGGNPLFIRLMLESAALGRTVDGVPATITALVGAMIDRLPAPEQWVLSAASVVGSTFTLEQLALLGEPVPSEVLYALVQRQLIRPTGQWDEYHFVQQPVHEVAYGRLDKERRLGWHRRLAEQDVNSPFNFEAAVRLLTDLRPDDAEREHLARRAAQALVGEGTAALRQRDVTAAIGLLGRALTLAPDGQDLCRSVAAIRLSDALMLSGDIARALDIVAETARNCAAEAGRWLCLVQQALLGARLGRVSEAAVAELMAGLERNRVSPLAWSRLEQLRMLFHLRNGRFGAAEQAVGAALVHARAVGDSYEEDRLLVALCEVRQWSPTPVADKLSGCDVLARRFAADRFLRVPVLAAWARCLALTGDIARARAVLAEAGTAVEQLQLTMGRILIDQAAGLVCSLDGDHARAETHLRAAADALRVAGHLPTALTIQVQAARARIRGQSGANADAADEILTLLGRREEMDARGRILCTATAIAITADDVSGLPRELLEDLLGLLAGTDDPCLRGEAYFDMAQAHWRAGSHADAASLADTAAASYASVGATRPLQGVLAWK